MSNPDPFTPPAEEPEVVTRQRSEQGAVGKRLAMNAGGMIFGGIFFLLTCGLLVASYSNEWGGSHDRAMWYLGIAVVCLLQMFMIDVRIKVHDIANEIIFTRWRMDSIKESEDKKS